MVEPVGLSLRRFAELGIVLALLAGHWWLAVSSTPHKSLTFDEVAHVGGGLLAWQGDTRFNAESGILPQRWATLPLLDRDLDLPAADHPARLQGNVWFVARDVLYHRGNDAGAIARAGRSMAALWSVALGAAVWAGSRRLFGTAGGLLSLVLFTVSPTILAHGRLITADLPAALFFLLASLALWHVFERATPLRLLAASLAVAGLLLCKHSGLLMAPIAAVLAGLRMARAGVSTRALSRLAGTALAVTVAVVVWIWGAYGFRYAADPRADGGPSVFVHSWESVFAKGGAGLGAVGLANDLRLLPESYLWGLAYTLDTTRERDAFLCGRTGTRGWWWFFPYAAAVKTPLALFAVLALAAARWARSAAGRWRTALRHGLYRAAPLWALAAVYGLAALASPLNIGHRHLLPLYPVAFLLAGGAVGTDADGRIRKPRWAVVVAVLCAVWLAGESWRIRPHYLSYFNPLAGGPANGYRHLVDSSLDWGQDLPALEDWIEGSRRRQAGREPIYVSFFGTAVPRLKEGSGVEWLASYFPLDDYHRPPPPLRGGVYCVSATHLQSLHLQTLGPWTGERERDLREQEARLERFRRLFESVAGRERLAGERTVAEWMALFRDVDRLRSARLFRYLRRREPDGRVGYSILVFRLSDGEVREALRASVDGVPGASP